MRKMIFGISLALVLIAGAYQSYASVDSATVSYSPSTPTNQNITATLHPPANVTITNNGGSADYIFNNNGSFTYSYTGNQVLAPTVFESGAVQELDSVVLNNGNILIAYADMNNSEYATFVIYDSSGNQIKAPTVIENFSASSISVITLDDGNFLIAYATGTTFKYGRFAIYDRDGNLVNAPTYFSNGSQQADHISVTLLSNGHVFIAYLDPSPNYTKFVILDGDGARVIDPIVIKSSSAYGITATALSNGNALIAYSDGDNNERGTFVIYDYEGILVKSATVFETDQVRWNEAITLDNGNALIAYSDCGNSYYGTFVIYDENGTRIKAPTVFKSATTGIHSVANLPNGNVTIPYWFDTGTILRGEYIIYDDSGDLIQSPVVFADSIPDPFPYADPIAISVKSDGNMFISYGDEDNSGYGTYSIYSGNTGSTIASVDWIDRTSPVIASHATVTAEATAASGATVTYTAPNSTDAVDGTVAAVCLPASGGTFPLGNTTVTCNRTDTAGNSATPTTFTIHVHDTTAPVIAVHETVTAEALAITGVVVTYVAPVSTDAVDGSVAATCSPAFGSSFAVGDTTVTCSRTDTAGTPAVSTTFMVHVQMNPLVHPTGTLVKIEGDPTVWYIDGGQRHGFSTPTEFLSQGFAWNLIVTISAEEMTTYPVGSNILIQSGTLIKDPDHPKVYLVMGSIVHPFGAAETFLNLGYNWDAIRTTIPGETLGYTPGSQMEPSVTHYPSTKIKTADSAAVFLLEQVGDPMQRRWVASEGVYLSQGWQWPEIITISQGEMNGYAPGVNLFYRDGTLIQGAGSSAVYVMEGQLKRPFPTGERFVQMGYSWGNIIMIPADECNAISVGAGM